MRGEHILRELQLLHLTGGHDGPPAREHRVVVQQQLHDARVAAMQAANRENSAAALCAKLPREDMLTSLSQQAQLLLQTEEPENRRPRRRSPPARRFLPAWTRNGSLRRRSRTCTPSTV